MRKAALLCVLLIAAALFLWFGFGRYLTLKNLHARHAELVALFAAHPFAFAGAFMAFQIAATMLAVPGAVLSVALAAGAIFGPAWGIPLVLIGVTAGDSLNLLIARYLLRDWVHQRLGARFDAIEQGFERDGAFYLLSLRLIAVAPNFLVNLAMGLTRMPLGIFAAVTFVGLAPLIALYVFAGAGIGQLGADAGPSVWMFCAFGLLALVPIGIRALIRRRSPGS